MQFKHIQRVRETYMSTYSQPTQPGAVKTRAFRSVVLGKIKPHEKFNRNSHLWLTRLPCPSPVCSGASLVCARSGEYEQILRDRGVPSAQNILIDLAPLPARCNTLLQNALERRRDLLGNSPFLVRAALAAIPAAVSPHLHVSSTWLADHGAVYRS